MDNVSSKKQLFKKLFWPKRELIVDCLHLNEILKFPRGRGSVISLSTWRFIICTSASDALETKLNQMSPIGGKRGKSYKESRQKSKTKSQLIRKFNLVSTLLWVGGFVALISTNGLLGLGQELSILKAEAAEFPVSPQLNVAKQALSNAGPVISDTLLLTDKEISAEEMTTPPDGFLGKPLVAETTIRRDPKPVAKPIKKTAPKTISGYRSGDSVSNHFPYGYCTYYVASKRSVPWFGNAGTWLSGAREYGYATGSAPKVGSIMVTYEGGRAGHVAFVEAVNGDQVTVSEMNYRGFGVTSSRVISAASSFIKGFIY